MYRRSSGFLSIAKINTKNKITQVNISENPPPPPVRDE